MSLHLILSCTGVILLVPAPKVPPYARHNLAQQVEESEHEHELTKLRVAKPMESENELWWDGLDKPDLPPVGPALSRDKTDTTEVFMETCAEEEVERNVHVLGLQNTGTDLLEGMLGLNFRGRVRRYQMKNEGNITLEDSPKTICGMHVGHGIWKHSNLEIMKDLEDVEVKSMRNQNVFALAMIRDPLAWFQSMRKAPYELEPCVTGTRWLTKACEHKWPLGPGHEANLTAFENVEEIYNQWNAAFDKAVDYGWAGALVIRYEDLVKLPHATMDRIAEATGLTPPEDGWQVLTESAKTHGKSHGRREALEAISHQTYMDSYSTKDVELVCSRLDPDLLSKYYPDLNCPKLTGRKNNRPEHHPRREETDLFG